MAADSADEARRRPPGRRAVQADETRSAILAAARRHFAAAGYAGTNLKDIAGDAGVSVQTVYDSVGPKPALIRALNDQIDHEAQIGEIASLVGTSDDPATIARVPAMITRRLIERCGDILRGVSAGGQAEPGLVPLVEEGGRRHRAGAAAVAGRLAGLGTLIQGTSVEEAARTIATLSDFRVALSLIDDHGLSFDEVEEWMARAIARMVLETG